MEPISADRLDALIARVEKNPAPESAFCPDDTSHTQFALHVSARAVLTELRDLRAQRAASRERVREVVREAMAYGWGAGRGLNGMLSSDLDAIAARAAEELAGQAVALSAGALHMAIEDAARRFAPDYAEQIVDAAMADIRRSTPCQAVALSAEERAGLAYAVRVFDMNLNALASLNDPTAAEFVDSCSKARRAIDRLLSTTGQGASPAAAEVAEPQPGPAENLTWCSSSEHGSACVPPCPAALSDAPDYLSTIKDSHGRTVRVMQWDTEVPAQPHPGPDQSAVDPALCRRLAIDLRANKLGGELVQWIDRRYLPGDDETADRLAREIRDEIDGGRCEPLEVFESDESEVARQLTAAARLSEAFEEATGKLAVAVTAKENAEHDLDAARAESERLRGYLGSKQEECAELRSALEMAQADRWAQLDSIRTLLATEPAVSEERCAEVGRVYDVASPVAVPVRLLAAARQLHALRAGLREIVAGEPAPRAWAVTPERVEAIRYAIELIDQVVAGQARNERIALAAMLAEVSP